MKFNREYIYKHSDCFSEKKVDFYMELMGFGDKTEFTIEEIIDSKMYLQDKAWFLFKNCKLSKNEIGIVLIKIIEVSFKYYATYEKGDDHDKIINDLNEVFEKNKKKLPPSAIKLRSELTKRNPKSLSDDRLLESGLANILYAIEFIIKGKTIKDILNKTTNGCKELNSALLCKPDLLKEIDKIFIESVTS